MDAKRARELYDSAVKRGSQPSAAVMVALKRWPSDFAKARIAYLQDQERVARVKATAAQRVVEAAAKVKPKSSVAKQTERIVESAKPKHVVTKQMLRAAINRDNELESQMRAMVGR